MEDITPQGAHTRETSQGRRSWTPRLVGTAAVVLAVGAASLAVTGPAGALDTAHTGPADAATGFPSFYTDNAGLSLQQCIDGTARCGGATATDDGAGGPGISVAPDGEGFYWTADATVNSARGSIDIVMAHEGAWATPTQRIVFSRLRVRGDLGRPGTYRLLTPYGTTRVVADGAGVVNQTSDPLCAQARGGACSARFDNWLRASNAPAGYLGNAATPSTFTGGTARNEFVLLAPDGTVIGRQRRAVIMGKLAPGPQAAMSKDVVDFGNTKAARTRSVVVRNLGDAALSLNRVRVVGARQVKVAPGGCGASVAARSRCTIDLVYRPGAATSVAGTLVVNDNSIARAHRLPVRAMSSSVVSAPRRLRFKAVKVGSQSRVRRIVVTNSGVRPMRFKGIAVTGSGARSFDRRSGRGPLCAKGATVRPRRSCAMYVAFAPRTFGAKTANLNVRTNAASSPDQVRLVGRGR